MVKRALIGSPPAARPARLGSGKAVGRASLGLGRPTPASDEISCDRRPDYPCAARWPGSALCGSTKLQCGCGATKMDTDQIKRALDRTRADFAKVPTSEHTRLVQAIIAENDVVLGVFYDDEDPRGWSHVVIKASRRFPKACGPRRLSISRRRPYPAKRPMKRGR